MSHMMWNPNGNSRFLPAHDVIELDDKIVVVVEVAGMRTDNFQIHLVGDRLVITGVRRRPAYERCAHHRVEIGYGEFRLDVPLHWAVQRDAVTATYADGFLQIDLPRRPEKHIEILTVEQGKTSDEQ